jgi:outer membrane protein OmpA-like peptidoglycan-associated protein
MNESRHLLCSVLILSLSLSMACAKRIATEPSPVAREPSLFVLLRDADGGVGQITVSNREGTQVLDKAWQATVVESAEQPPGAPVRVEEREVQEIFAEALAAQPLPPAHFILYFESGSVELTPESRDLLAEIIDAIDKRASVDTSVVGHTDTAGTKAYNYKLSL